MDAETLKYLDALKDDMHKQFDSVKTIIKDGLNGLDKRVSNLERDTTDLEKEFQEYIKEQKAKEEKKDNRDWDWKKSLTIILVASIFTTVLGVSVNSMISTNAENKRMQIELQKKELELREKELQEKLKTK